MTTCLPFRASVVGLREMYLLTIKSLREDTCLFGITTRHNDKRSWVTSKAYPTSHNNSSENAGSSVILDHLPGLLTQTYRVNETVGEHLRE